MTSRWSLILVVLVALVALGACGKAVENPPPTTDKEGAQAASTLFAQPTRATRPTPTVTPMNAIEFELNRTVARMEQAIQAGDLAGYLTYVWDGDPIFWAEHRAWARDWVENPLATFNIELYGIHAVSDAEATARMTWRWRQATRSGDDTAGGTTITVVFYQQDGRWVLGGERWETAEVEGIKLYYQAGVADYTAQAQAMLAYLPEVRRVVTRAFGYVPAATAHIKLYESPTMLFNWTRLSQPDLTTWNWPGEAIKLTLTPIKTAPEESIVAREYTRFLLFELSGGERSRFSWWLEDGISEYGGSLFYTLSQRNRVLKRVAALSLAPEAAEERLLGWDELATADDLTADERQLAIDQTFVLVHYITETYGAEARNAWIRAMAEGQTLGEACQSALGLSFVELDAAWWAWLPEQL